MSALSQANRSGIGLQFQSHFMCSKSTICLLVAMRSGHAQTVLFLTVQFFLV